MAIKFNQSKLSSILETQQGKTYTVFGVTILIVAVMFFFAIRPAYTSITDKIAENNAKELYIDDANAKLLILDELASKKTVNQNAIDLLNDYYLSEKPIESFVTGNIVNLIQDRGLSINSMNFSEPQEVSNNRFEDVNRISQVSQVDVTFNISGGLEQIGGVLNEIEGLGKIINVNNFSLSYRVDGENNTWQASVDMTYYFWDINDIREGRDV